ncbi:uncharacterized protein PG986_014983 [Apiospora aurea]|uniref:Zn(2)-C6 fungal-type domain-containing protein n=1 Tax=Apiospora aurea TaxID=335848 RepID=A0ABR1PUJ3_9PEZI
MSQFPSQQPPSQQQQPPLPQQQQQQQQRQTSESGADPSPQPPQHKRVYQACIPCRRRKVRCDLGSVDSPHDPPCVRCRRESKECYFSATRRKRKHDEDGEEEGDEAYIVRNGRKQHHLSLSEASPPPSINKHAYRNVPLTPGGSTGRNQPLKRPDSDQDSGGKSRGGSLADIGDGEPNAQMENLEAQSVMRQEVYGPHDALDLLYKAATNNVHGDAMHRRQESISTVAQPSPATIQTKTPNDSLLNAHVQPSRVQSKSAEPIDPRLMTGAQGYDKETLDKMLDLHLEPGYEDALKAWSRFRFVRAGWFTSQEAIKYIAYYFKFLSPMTPISPPTFGNPGTHYTLLIEEPILAVTLLTIASRYYIISGPGGHCRSHAIHEELWRYLRRMIERCVWGQEAFGGGFCGSGADESLTSSTAPWRGLRKGSLRTLGTIESLMILTEWHPRALHFPPDEAIDELMLPSYDANMHTDEDGNFRGDVGGKRIEGWLEPAWRSDRMCWMLLSTAMGLAYELGVFDNIEELLATNAITRPEYEDEGYRLRALRIKRLLLIYATQLAGRLGWTNMVPESIRSSDPALRGFKQRPSTNDGNTPGTNTSSATFNYVPDVDLDDRIIHCWVGVSNAMHLGNERLFRSRKHTTEIIQTGKYTAMLKDFQPILKDWWKDFERFQDMPPYIRHILTIEYEYVRIYVNSLALQAVVERCTNKAGRPSNGTQGPGANGQSMLSPQTQSFLGALPLGHLGDFRSEDQQFVKEVVEGSRNLLRTVVHGLLPDGYLKHAPVRTYFRIISGAMFLLKTFALGAPKSDINLSIMLMDQTVAGLRGCVVDDVHLGIRFGDLLESLTYRLRSRFKHAPTQNMQNDSRSGDVSRAESANGQLSHPIGIESGYLSSKLKESLDRSTTPSMPITATPFDLNTSNYTFMHGASSLLGSHTPAVSGSALDHSISDNIFEPGTEWTNPEDPTWYLPPGPGLFQNMGENSNVTMTDQGVNIGGLDLLDYMAMDPSNFNAMEGSGF